MDCARRDIARSEQAPIGDQQGATKAEVTGYFPEPGECALPSGDICAWNEGKALERLPERTRGR